MLIVSVGHDGRGATNSGYGMMETDAYDAYGARQAYDRSGYGHQVCEGSGVAQWSGMHADQTHDIYALPNMTRTTSGKSFSHSICSVLK